MRGDTPRNRAGAETSGSGNLLAIQTVSIDDKYEQSHGRVLLSGSQALARLPMIQKEWDRAAGLDTAGYISGYPGSPLGDFDAALLQAREQLSRHDIVFQPGLNEDLAATAAWGTQQLENFPGAQRYDGVFALWYAKGPGVDRSGDAIKHANFAGVHPHGGVLAVYGDDHSAKSSSIAHQCDQAFAAFFVPILYPASVHEYLEYGLKGWALSRYSGLWVAFKGINETLAQTATIDLNLDPSLVTLPEGGIFPPEGVHFLPRSPDPVRNDRLIKRFKIPLAHHFARANGLDRSIIAKGDRPRLGIVTAGKSFIDTLQALRLLGVDESRALALGISLYKVGMIWPLEPRNLTEFAEGQEELLVVEEKAAFLENQICALLINNARRPRVTGKQDEAGNFLLPSDVLLEPLDLAFVIAARLESLGVADEAIRNAVARLRVRTERVVLNVPRHFVRAPFFCSGCPYNTALKLPEDSTAFAGMGCHAMAMFYSSSTTMTCMQMGGEGANWMGLAPFTTARHVFQNLGDGTYHHSGSLAIRASVAAGTNITYKIMVNGVIAMTGGQDIAGPLSVAAISNQIHHEGVRRIAVVSDQPSNHTASSGLAPGVEVHHRDEMDRVQRAMREIPGTTAIIYEQACATNKRRLRKRGRYADPPKRMFINKDVCEGCGDCSDQSNCLSVHPLETELGLKRRIDQSTCNKDYSCVKGFCPSFVTVLGGELTRKASIEPGDGVFAALPAPRVAALEQGFSAMISGIGGEGVVTIGAVLAMAAHVEGKRASNFVMTGMAQKGGAVHSHLRIASDTSSVMAARIGNAEADLLLGCDLVASAAVDSFRTVDPARTYVLGNSRIAPTASFTKDPNASFDSSPLIDQIRALVGEERCDFVDATNLASSLTGNSLATNMFMVGVASQKGLLPIGTEAINRAIELNGTAVSLNKLAYKLGRMAVHDPAVLERLLAGQSTVPVEKRKVRLEEIVADRSARLEQYQDEAYARTYAGFVSEAASREKSVVPGSSVLAVAVARNLARLMAYKDEYEVARLYSSPEFLASLRAEIAGDVKLRFNLAPPLFARKDPRTGHLLKREYGGWVLPVFRVLAKLKVLRGTAFDIAGYTAERKSERQLIADYRDLMSQVMGRLTPENHARAVELANTPDRIRGYGHVKDRNIATARLEQAALLEKFSNDGRPESRLAAA